jgi:hypothetical protein
MNTPSFSWHSYPAHACRVARTTVENTTSSAAAFSADIPSMDPGCMLQKQMVTLGLDLIGMVPPRYLRHQRKCSSQFSTRTSIPPWRRCSSHSRAQHALLYKTSKTYVSAVTAPHNLPYGCTRHKAAVLRALCHVLMIHAQYKPLHCWAGSSSVATYCHM